MAFHLIYAANLSKQPGPPLEMHGFITILLLMCLHNTRVVETFSMKVTLRMLYAGITCGLIVQLLLLMELHLLVTTG